MKQVSAEVRKKFHKNPRTVKLSDFDLEYKSSEPENINKRRPLTKEEIAHKTALSKARWGHILRNYEVTKSE